MTPIQGTSSSRLIHQSSIVPQPPVVAPAPSTPAATGVAANGDAYATAERSRETPPPREELHSVVEARRARSYRRAESATVDREALVDKNSSSEEIQPMQESLASLGFYKGKADGILGPGTEEAVRKFQEKHGIKPNGIVGQSTLDALEDVAPDVDEEDLEALVDKDSSSEEIQPLQEALAKLGFYKGKADGIWGSGTEEAVRRFQEKHGIKPASGIVNQLTHDTLEDQT